MGLWIVALRGNILSNFLQSSQLSMHSLSSFECFLAVASKLTVGQGFRSFGICETYRTDISPYLGVFSPPPPLHPKCQTR